MQRLHHFSLCVSSAKSCPQGCEAPTSSCKIKGHQKTPSPLWHFCILLSLPQTKRLTEQVKGTVWTYRVNPCAVHSGFLQGAAKVETWSWPGDRAERGNNWRTQGSMICSLLLQDRGFSILAAATSGRHQFLLIPGSYGDHLRVVGTTRIGCHAYMDL